MKKKLVSLLLLLCIVFSVFALASCNNGKKKKTEEPTKEQTTVLTTDKWEVYAPQVKALAEDCRQLHIEYSTVVSAEKGSKNDVYVKGPDFVDTETPDIEVMVYNRNKAAESLLGVTIKWTPWNYGYGKACTQIDTLTQAFDEEAPDLFMNMVYDMSKSVLNKSFKDIYSIPGSYFDFKADGWLEQWMENLSFTGDRAYILGGDYFLDVYRSVSLLPFNMTMMDENASKLSAAIIGEETLGTGEKLSSRFFDLVDSGNWTWDILGQLCEAIWEDKDGNNQDSIYDQLGIIADTYGGINAASYIFCCGEQLTEVYTIEDPTSKYNGKQWIKYPDSCEALNQIFDAVKSVFQGNGSFSTGVEFKGSTPENPGTTYHHIKFGQGELLFAGVCMLGALEDDAFKNMQNAYSVVPLPKINADKEYNSIIINQGDAGAINVNCDPVKTRALSAYLQYCTEKSSNIREKFQQIVTKYETMTYNQGTDRVLDLIYDSIIYDRDKTVEDLVCLDRGDRWHSKLKGDGFTVGSEYISGIYKSLCKSKQAQLDEDMKIWYTLPIVEPEAE